MDILNKKILTTTSILLLFIVLLAAGTVITIAANNATQKQKVVAGAIFKFIKFVEWENNLGVSQQNFHMCLQQYDSAFEPFTQRKVQGKRIKLLILDAGKQADNCDALYLNTAQSNHVEILKTYKNKSVLTISEQPGFSSQGGVMELGNHNNRLTFIINQRVAKANNLNIGFQLLSLAKNVIES